MTHTGRRARRGPRLNLGALLEQLFQAAAPAGEAWQETSLPEPEHGIWLVQKRLQALGLWPEGAPLDGRPSEATRAALRRFQKLAGLRPDGDVHDPQTRLLLREQARHLRCG